VKKDEIWFKFWLLIVSSIIDFPIDCNKLIIPKNNENPKRIQKLLNSKALSCVVLFNYLSPCSYNDRFKGQWPLNNLLISFYNHYILALLGLKILGHLFLSRLCYMFHKVCYFYLFIIS
jgi:hypothetical protein